MNSQTAASEDYYRRILALAIDRVVTAEADDIAERGSAIAAEAWKDGKGGLTDAQLNGLNALAITAGSVTHIDRYIERQTARRPAWQEVGPALRLELKKLQQTATDRTQTVKSNLQGQDVPEKVLSDTQFLDKKERSPRIHLRLAQELVAAFASAYRYQDWLTRRERAGARQ